MRAPSRVRQQQRASSEAAILDAAFGLLAARGPDAVSLRDVAAAAGCSHALVARYFGSKEGLVGAVAARLATSVDRCVDRAQSTADDPVLELLAAARAHRPWVQLLVRSALGDLPPRGFPACLRASWLLSALPATNIGVAPLGAAGPGRRDRLGAYAAASLLLGFVTFEGFLVTATGLGRMTGRRRDAAVAAAARHLLDAVADGRPALVSRDLDVGRHEHLPADSPPATSRQALLRSAIELFAARGPASVSVRDAARHAGVNQGLIYRHFGSKEALLAEAIEQGLAGLFPAALAAEGFDFDGVSWLLHHGSPGPRLIARTLVDDIDIATVRRRYPVLRRLLEAYDHVPLGAGPGDLSDPRVVVTAAAAMALGSAVWGAHLRPVLGLSERDGIEAAVADLARLLVAVPLSSGSVAEFGP